MKKYKALFVLSALLLTGCGEKQISRVDHIPPESSTVPGETADLTPTGVPEAPQVEGITAKTEQECYPPDVDTIRLHITNDRDTDYILPEQFTMLYIFPLELGYETVSVPYKEGGDSFIDLAQELPAHGETDVTLDIAGHYDLPLEDGYSGFFRIYLGEITADFRISADSSQPEQIPQQEIILDTEMESYSAGAKEITVRLINASASDFTFTNADFGIECFSDGVVSMTRFSPDSPAAQKGMTLASEDCEMWTLPVSGFGGLTLQPGEYAVYLNGNEAHFTVTE